MSLLIQLLLLVSILFAYPLPVYAGTELMPGELIKAHEKEEAHCDKCHIKFDKEAQSRLCADCHKDVKKDIAEKRGYHGRLDDNKECKECHHDHDGRDAKIAEFDHVNFDHTKTDYPLTGAHKNEKAKCTDCHKTDKKYRDAPNYCNECHKKDDKHKKGLGTDCGKCHVDKDWKSIDFDHNKTKFKLLGKHEKVKCIKCHIDNQYKDTPRLCNSCHKKDDKHKASFGTKCEDCHVEKKWKDIVFDHDKATKYLLLGKHKQTKCVNCHKGDSFKDKLPGNCYACHKKNDKHKGQEGKNCETCHNEKDWAKTTFNHGFMSAFPLRGLHVLVECKKCHTVLTFKDAKSACLSCHEKKDVHRRKLGTECQICHNERNWKTWDFDHNKSRFKLSGIHRNVAEKCYSCHREPMLAKVELSPVCGGCHDGEDVHDGAFGENCERCHKGNDWKRFKIGMAYQNESNSASKLAQRLYRGGDMLWSISLDVCWRTLLRK
jgi:hypothetical protein